MSRTLAVAALVAMAASPAFARGGCATGPSSHFQPKAKLEAKLKAEGLDVRRIKVENGCYEVYALDHKGRRVNAAYNAITFKRLANAEAGEE